MGDEYEAHRLATELARLRQRGIAYADQVGRRQQVVATPLLNALARSSGFDLEADRGLQLADFLHQRLTEYGHRRPADAGFVRSLYFDDDGLAPGRATAAELLREARRQRHLTVDAFHHLQRAQLIAFARFLIRAEAAREDVADSPRFFAS